MLTILDNEIIVCRCPLLSVENKDNADNYGQRNCIIVAAEQENFTFFNAVESPVGKQRRIMRKISQGN